MSRRRDAVESYFEQEEERYQRARDTGSMSDDEYRQAMRDIQREAQQASREAMEDDMRDVQSDWGY